MERKIGFCMGITIDEYYRESTCDRRDNCRYYVEGFYAANISHIDDFEQLYNIPGKECTHYLPRHAEMERKETTNPFEI